MARRKMLQTKEGTPRTSAADIINCYPRNQDTEGLVTDDFQLLLPTHVNMLTENWTFIKKQTIEVVKEKLKENKNTTQEKFLRNTLQILELRESNQINNDDNVIALLVGLLPLTNHGRKQGIRITIEDAVKRLLDFQKIGTDVEALLQAKIKEYSDRRQPYLMAIASNGDIEKMFAIVDHKYLPAPTNVVMAVDMLFKLHYVFGVDYDLTLKPFFEFLQTGIYQIDVENTNSSTVKLLAAKYCHIFK